MDFSQIQIIFQLFLALFFGALIGLERELKKKDAGLQTYTLVCLGSCLFSIITFKVFNIFINQPHLDFDPSKIVLAVATGIGFIGAGVIMQKDFHIQGLTTAAGLWMVAAIGVAVGSGLYLLSFTATLLAVFVLIIFGEFERRALRKQ